MIKLEVIDFLSKFVYRLVLTSGFGAATAAQLNFPCSAS